MDKFTDQAPVTVNGVTLTLLDFQKVDANIPLASKPKGPLVNISDIEGTSDTPYTVTVLAYLPDNTLKPITNTSGLQLQGNQIYLNYYGTTQVQYISGLGVTETLNCRDFRVEFDCEEEANQFDLYYIQYTYQLDPGTPSVDAILVRDDDEDPETDRGTVTMPAKDE